MPFRRCIGADMPTSPAASSLVSLSVSRKTYCLLLVLVPSVMQSATVRESVRKVHMRKHWQQVFEILPVVLVRREVVAVLWCEDAGMSV